MLQPGDNESGQSGRTVSHYRILDQIGRGGMGHVYRARDDRLKRDVAVKVLPPNLLSDDTASKRFIREARVASRLVHPYVATVFDVIEEGEELFLVMELIEGKRLSTLLREDQPPPEERLRWALEIAEALSSIHRTGLVHRDIKPGNVMITPDSHVKVMDFGLARQTQDAPTETVGTTRETVVTREGVGIGTLLYMSPEQLRAQQVDQRSDLFSFGVVMYELISGVHPFRRASQPDSIAAILNDLPGGGQDPDSLTNTGPVRDIVLKLLEKEPDDRYQTIDEVVRQLQAIMRSETSSPAVPSPGSRGLRVGPVLAVVVVLAAVGLGGYRWITRPPTANHPRVSIALAPFSDSTGEENGTELAGMVTDFLSIDLGASRLVRSVGPRQTAPLLEGMDPDSDVDVITQLIARGTTVDYVLVGTLYKEGDQYLASVELAPINAEIPALPKIRSEGVTVIDLVENLGATLRGNLPDVSRLNAWRDDRTQLVALTSESDVATLHYEKGLIALREVGFADAARHFEKAIEADSDFVLAHARLAGALHSIGYGRRAREAATKAVELAPEGGTLAERWLGLLVRAVRAEVFSRPADAVDLTERLVDLIPDDPELLQMNAKALIRAGELKRGRERIEQALALDPINASLHLDRADMQVAAVSFDDALDSLPGIEDLSRVVESEEGLARVATLRARVFITRERYDEAKHELDQAFQTFDRLGSGVLAVGALRLQADIELLQGRTKSADALLAAAAEVAREAGHLGLECKVLSSRGAQQFVSGNFEAAETLLREAVDKARQLENERLLINPLSNLGSLLRYTGRLEEARAELVPALEMAFRLRFSKTEVKCLRSLADIDYQMGNIDAAIESYEKLLSEGQGEKLKRSTAWTWLSLSEVHERRGDLGTTLDVVETAVDMARRLSLDDALGYGLVQQTLVSSALGRTEAALAQMEEACAIASAPDAGLDDLAARCLLIGAVIRGHQGDWKAAVEEAERAAAHPGAGAPVVLSAALAVACEGLIETGEFARAIERCNAALADKAIPRSEDTIARALLGEALLRTGQHERALEEAQTAFDQAERMGLRLPLARSATVLLELVPEGQRPPIREQGLEALGDYVSSAPTEDRERLRARPDFKQLETRLGDVPE